jgi:hypothetical protein
MTEREPQLPWWAGVLVVLAMIGLAAFVMLHGHGRVNEYSDVLRWIGVVFG